ncbi:unnamed protein product [Peronospora farinosa]|uniref:Uncharacterized protein n=1 Tax=Peronospora farinosa TaxID=134698 RepID=A0AAV0UTJ9_9STRA|nr:unnamed protein product [Peronospora farinosa]CAI5739035.1 unnamed protein product [Peronospora farinosa]
MKVRRSSSLRLRQLLGFLLSMSAFVSADTAPSLYDYKYDGTTTYCYWMDQGMQVTNLDFAYVLQQGTGSQCPLTISLEQATTGVIIAGTEVEYAFTATLNLNDNVFNFNKLQAVVPDPTTGLPMQIGHANIHTCLRSTVCDIFRTGANRKIVDQESSNFSSAGTASFRQRITYNSVGERNVFAHIILPPTNYLKRSYHFVSFITTNVEASTTSADNDDSSGLSTGLTVGLIVGGVAIVAALILSVVFWRGKRRPGLVNDHFRNSGFGLPASYVANKSKSHLDWNAEPEARLTSHGSGFKENYPTRDGSNGCRCPGLNASALVFNDRLSRQNKTVSSSCSLHSSHGHGDSRVMYNNYDTPTQRSGNNFGASGHSARDPFNDSQSIYPDDSMYESEFRIPEEDPNLECGRTPDLETFGIGPGGPSLDSETSMGSSFEYKTDHSHFSQPPINPLLNGYGRESDLSSMGETEEYDMYEQRPPRTRSDTMDALLTGMPDDNGREVGENRSSSVSSIGTVDFTQDEPSVRSLKPMKFEPLDETLTMSAIAKAKVAIGDHANPSRSANSKASHGNKHLVVNDSSTASFATSNVSSDFASTAGSVDIFDGKMKFDNTINIANEYASDVVSTADFATNFESSTVTDIVASSEFSDSGNGDFTKPNSHSDYDEGSSLNSELEGSSYSSGLSGSSFGADEIGSSYGTGLTGPTLGTEVADSALVATKTENDFNNTHSTYDFDDQSFRASNSFATTALDDELAASKRLRPRRVSSADGESYEF